MFWSSYQPAYILQSTVNSCPSESQPPKNKLTLDKTDNRPQNFTEVPKVSKPLNPNADSWPCHDLKPEVEPSSSLTGGPCEREWWPARHIPRKVVSYPKPAEFCDATVTSATTREHTCTDTPAARGAYLQRRPYWVLEIHTSLPKRNRKQNHQW